MPLAEGQVQIRDLLMGPNTDYRIGGFNPFRLNARATGSGERAWAHGGWSGAEWAEARVVPMRILAENRARRDVTGWMESHQRLAAAFRPVGDSVSDVEMRFCLGGREYIMSGRPRMSDPDMENIGLGYAVTQAAFVALNPLIYAGDQSTAVLSLPVYTGGLSVPVTVPLAIESTQVGGIATVINDGTADTAMLLRIDGPVTDPRVVLRTADGTVKTLRFAITLAVGQWLDVDTAAKSVLLNGIPTNSRRGDTAGEFFELPPAAHELSFHAAEYQAAAQLTATWRSAWW
jgi:hypothetical protein